MRKEICYENALAVGDHFLLEGSVLWEEDRKYPIVWNFDYTVHSLLGHAQDFRREEDGAITAEMVFAKDDIEALVKEDNLPATFEGNEIVQEICDGVRAIHRIKLRGISIVTPAAVPWGG